MELCKQFMEKHSFALGVSLTKVPLDLCADILLKNTAEVLATYAKLLEDSPVDDTRVRRAQLMVEELGETIFALAERNEELTLDGLSDLRFVTDGTALAFDLPLEAGCLEVCNSNLSKGVRQEGNDRLRDKGPDYIAPDMKKILNDYHKPNCIFVKAVRTNCMTQVEKEVTICVNREQHESLDNSWWLHIVEGGVTGYESIRENLIINNENDSGWSACAGTKGQWDKLYVPLKSLNKVVEWLRK